jgi:hypothetical protein
LLRKYAREEWELFKIRKYSTLLVIVSIMLFLSSDIVLVDRASGFDTAQEVITNIWYHDCSNLTAFSGIGNESWFADNVTAVSGVMNTTGDFFYSNDTGFGEFGHGPFRYHTLAQPFPVSQFVSLQAELEVYSSDIEVVGGVLVYLYDDQLREILAVKAAVLFADSGREQRQPQTRWRYSDSTLVETPTDQPEWEQFATEFPYHETLVLSQNETGLFAEIPRSGNYSLLASEAIESDRTVAYIAVMMYGIFSFQVCELLRVHDIQLTYTTSAVETTAPTTTTSTTPTATTPPSPFDFLLFPVLTVIGVIIVLVLWRRMK